MGASDFERVAGDRELLLASFGARRLTPHARAV